MIHERRLFITTRMIYGEILPIEVMDVDVHKHAEKPRQDFLAERLKWAWEPGIIVLVFKHRSTASTYGISVVIGKMSSLLICPSTQSIKFSMYFGAGSAVGFLYLSPSAQKYSYLVDEFRCNFWSFQPLQLTLILRSSLGRSSLCSIPIPFRRSG